MGRERIEELLRLCDEAFRQPHSGDGDSPSLLANLASVPPEALDWLPPGGNRSIRRIFVHAGGCKYLYDDHAFRSASLRWDSPPGEPANAAKLTMGELVAWAEDGHRLWLESIRALDSDDELERPRRTSWGQLKPTRDLVTTLLYHDTYHAGEINHLRALFMQDDGWAFE